MISVRHGIGALAVVLLSGCGPEIVHFAIPDIPEEISYVAVISLDVDGAPTSSGLIRVDALRESKLEIESPSERTTVQLIGFAESTLADLDAPSDTVLDQTPLRPSTGCEWPLPSFDFAAALEGEGALPEMTADWLMQDCPDPTEMTVDLRCGIAPCEMQVEAKGCAVNLSLPRCGIGEVEQLRGVIRRDGRLELCIERGGQCSVASAEAPVGERLVCTNAGTFSTDCQLDFFVERNPPDLDATTIRLVDGMSKLPVDLEKEIDHHLLEAGYLRDILPLEDRVLVVTHGGEYAEGPNDTPTLSISELVEIDPRSDTVVGTTTAPPGLDHLVATSDGRGFFAVFVEQRTPWLGAFDLDARLERAIPLPIEAIGFGNRVLAADLVRMPGTETLVVLLHDNTNDRGVLISYSTENLELSKTLDLAPNGDPIQPRALAPMSATRIAITEDEANRVLLVDLDSSDISYAVLPISASSLGRLEFHQPSGRLIVPSTGTSKPILVVESPRALSQALFFEDVTGIPTGAASDEIDPADVFVAVTTGVPPDLEAHLAKLDPLVPRVLPGLLPLGFGAVGRLRSDPRGDLWITLPFVGTVVHLRPN